MEDLFIVALISILVVGFIVFLDGHNLLMRERQRMTMIVITERTNGY